MKPARSATRRCVLATACVALASVATLASCAPSDSAVSSEVSGNKRARYGFWMDTRTCVGCASCVAACREASDTPDDCEARRKLVSYTFEQGQSRFVSVSCMHCAHPACVAVCPAGAVSKREDGIVAVDQSRCIGCRYCREACPFGVPHYTSLGMDKCDCCLGAGVKPDEEPYCVQACPAKALHFGELEDLRRQVEEAAGKAELLEAPTEPSFYLT
ncbi:4Fe-4S dicluster domain-containing protein [Raoultibacter phocaeensis]|uniref:4Fe-4S dicluster domain-containing protein n=1 Tax=Raoultibacter phocaeensis TaxID=2479841 RepID=UPI002729FBF3|nr:4Fe-4S dicluster domain-containing protein [Raoultibacter phocaeensis]